MKKFFVALLLCFSGFTSFLSAGEFSFDCGLMNFAVECNDGGPGGTCDFNILDVNFFSEKNGLGVSLSPFSIYTHINDSDYKSKIEFLNLSFFYDFFHFERNLELKPVITVGLLNPSDLWDFTAKCGLNFSLFKDKGEFDYFRLRIVSAETGVKYCDKSTSFYCNVGFDAGIIFYGILRAIYENSLENYYN